MTELTTEQLAEIRRQQSAWNNEFRVRPAKPNIGIEDFCAMHTNVARLLAHVDAQAARIAELEKEIHRTRHPLLSGFVEDARVEHAAKAAWPAFKSGLEGANWAQAPQLRKDRLRIIVRTALTAALTQPEQPEAGRDEYHRCGKNIRRHKVSECRSEQPITHCEHSIDRAYRCIDCIEAERDALRARVEELEIEREAQRSCAIYWMDQEDTLRASIAALADEWEGHALANEQGSYPDEARIKAYRYCATKLRKLGEGNGRD